MIQYTYNIWRWGYEGMAWSHTSGCNFIEHRKKILISCWRNQTKFIGIAYDGLAFHSLDFLSIFSYLLTTTRCLTSKCDPLEWCLVGNNIISVQCTCRLAVQKEQFLKKKETLMKEIHTKKEFLDSLQPRLENILKVKICSS